MGGQFGTHLLPTSRWIHGSIVQDPRETSNIFQALTPKGLRVNRVELRGIIRNHLWLVLWISLDHFYSCFKIFPPVGLLAIIIPTDCHIFQGGSTTLNHQPDLSRIYIPSFCPSEAAMDGNLFFLQLYSQAKWVGK